jgi:hypothetical protein
MACSCGDQQLWLSTDMPAAAAAARWAKALLDFAASAAALKASAIIAAAYGIDHSSGALLHGPAWLLWHHQQVVSYQLVCNSN